MLQYIGDVAMDIKKNHVTNSLDLLHKVQENSPTKSMWLEIFLISDFVKIRETLNEVKSERFSQETKQYMLYMGLVLPSYIQYILGSTH